MKKILLLLPVLTALLLLTGCVSGERLVRNTPFASGGNSFYRDGVNLFPLYYSFFDFTHFNVPFLYVKHKIFKIKDSRCIKTAVRSPTKIGIIYPRCSKNQDSPPPPK